MLAYVEFNFESISQNCALSSIYNFCLSVWLAGWLAGPQFDVFPLDRSDLQSTVCRPKFISNVHFFSEAQAV